MLTISALTGTSCIRVTLARLPARFILPAARSLATATARPGRAAVHGGQAVHVRCAKLTGYVGNAKALASCGGRFGRNFKHAALAVPQKYDTGKWAHDTARVRLAALAAGPPPPTRPPAATAGAQAMPAVAGRRVALVIGNSGYSAVPPLPNPKRDAAAVAAALREVGFQSVTVINDASRDAMVKALSAFGREADNADWALVYFAGHGIVTRSGFADRRSRPFRINVFITLA